VIWGRRSPLYACSGGIGGCGQSGGAAGRVAADAPDGGPGAAGRPGGVGVRAEVGRLPGARACRGGRAGPAEPQRVDMAGWFPELGGLAGALGEHAAVLDGEVVAFDAEGRPSFEALQQRMASRVGRRRGAAVTYLVFDLLWLDGRLLTGLPYAERRRLLEELEVAGPAWQTVGSFPGTGTVPGRRLRPRPRPGPLAARRPARPGPAGPAALRRPGRPRPGPSGGSGSCWPRWSSSRARSASPRRTCSGAAGPGQGPATRPRCSSAPSWPWRSPSWAGSRDGCATLPGAA
jgi:hypothetical protein